MDGDLSIKYHLKSDRTPSQCYSRYKSPLGFVAVYTVPVGVLGKCHRLCLQYTASFLACVPPPPLPPIHAKVSSQCSIDIYRCLDCGLGLPWRLPYCRQDCSSSLLLSLRYITSNVSIRLEFKGALSQEFCCFQLHSLLKSLPGTFTCSQNAQKQRHIKQMVAQRANHNEFLAIYFQGLALEFEKTG